MKPDPLIGRSLGEFAIRERLGEGGFGVVYRAYQSTLDREAVVKVLHRSLRKSKGITERFLREAKLASKLDHPYAAHIYAFGVEPTGELWIAMELVRGTPLDQILKFQGKIALERFVPLLERIAEVVHTAHEQGIIHRDLKPPNVMVLSRAGRLLPKLLDFGIAKGIATDENSLEPPRPAFELPSPPADVGDDSFGGDGDSAATIVEARGGGDDHAGAASWVTPAPAGSNRDRADRTHVEGTPRKVGDKVAPGGITRRGMIVGSPHYMAPEQWTDPRLVDSRTDQYALAVVAYECLTDTMPFNGPSMTEIEKAHKTQLMPSLGPGFPDALDRVLARACAKRPSERYDDVLAFATAFRDATGLSAEVVHLPSLDAAARDAAIASAPQPIADAVAALGTARNVHQARDLMLQLVRTIVRYLALLALTCRSRVSLGDDAPSVTEALRSLYRRTLSDLEWLELARSLTEPWLDRSDAYAIPELVDMLHTPGVVSELEALASLPQRAADSPDTMFDSLERSMVRCSSVLAALSFLDDYPLVLTLTPELGERWVGARRASRATTPIRGKNVAAGVPVVIDRDGVPVVTLAPLVQAAAPTPGAPIELFQFEGRDNRGAKFVALPAGFEHHDDTVWDWFRTELSASLGDAVAGGTDEAAPYLGLRAFSIADSASFVGRERQVDAFVNRLKLQPLLAVVGPSGAGKSSFVHAGVVPAMPEDWRTITMRPGSAPVAALSAKLEAIGLPRITREALAHDKDWLGEALRRDAHYRGPLMLIVDQLEELFVLCHNTEERRVFAEAISSVARGPDDSLRVILTLRDDFLVRSETVPALRNRIGLGLQLLTVPVSEDLVRILVEPARKLGYEFEHHELPLEMVKEVADQPGALALLSFTAAKLWELRDRQFKQLTRSAYVRLGGVGGALARHADQTLDEMPIEERFLARQAFRQLVTSQNTRAVHKRNDLRQMLGSTPHADSVIEKLVNARLLVASENEAGADTIEIVHEALLVAWPRLVEWRREDAEGARFREQLRAAARQWDERGRGRDLIWRGNALAELQQWRARHLLPLTDLEDAFAKASVYESERASRRRRALLAGSFAVLLVGVVALGVLNARVADQRRIALESAHKAELSEASAKANADKLHDNLLDSYEAQARGYVIAGDYERALTYLDEARKLGASGSGVELLASFIASGLSGGGHRFVHDAEVVDARFSHDGKRLLTAGLDGKVRLWDVANGKLVADLQHGALVLTAQFTSDGKILTASDTVAVLWDAAGKRKLVEYDAHRPDVHLWMALASQDGSRVITVANDDRVWLWDSSGNLIKLLQDTVRMDTALNLTRPCSFDPEGRRIACADHNGVVRVWDAATGKLLGSARGHTEIGLTIAFTGDGRRFVTASEDKSAVVWDAATVKPLVRVRHDDAVNGAVFSPDGRWIATASNDRTAKVWDAQTGDRLLTIDGHTAGVNYVAFSPDGKQLATVSDDAVVMLWDVTSGRRVSRLIGHNGAIFKVSYDDQGRHLVTMSHDKSAIVWSPQAQQRAVRLSGHAGRVNGVALSADGAVAATGGIDGTVRVWDPKTGVEKRRLATDGGAVTAIAMAPSGKLLATAGAHGIRLWNPANGAQIATLPGGQTDGLEWSADGTMLLSTDADGSARLWTPKGEQVVALRGQAPIVSASFSPKADRVVTVSSEHSIRIWNAKTGSEIAHWDTPFTDARFDPSGELLVAHVDLDVEIWRVSDQDRHPIARMKHEAEVTSARWSANGDFIVTASIDGTLRIWDRGGHVLVALRDGLTVQWGAQFVSNDRLIASFANNGAVLWELPPAVPSFEQLARCKHYELHGNQIVPTDRPAGCD